MITVRAKVIETDGTSSKEPEGMWLLISGDPELLSALRGHEVTISTVSCDPVHMTVSELEAELSGARVHGIEWFEYTVDGKPRVLVTASGELIQEQMDISRVEQLRKAVSAVRRWRGEE
jgi:hypothetical protein